MQMQRISHYRKDHQQLYIKVVNIQVQSIDGLCFESSDWYVFDTSMFSLVGWFALFVLFRSILVGCSVGMVCIPCQEVKVDVCELQ